MAGEWAGYALRHWPQQHKLCTSIKLTGGTNSRSTVLAESAQVFMIEHMLYTYMYSNRIGQHTLRVKTHIASVAVAAAAHHSNFARSPIALRLHKVISAFNCYISLCSHRAKHTCATAQRTVSVMLGCASASAGCIRQHIRQSAQVECSATHNKTYWIYVSTIISLQVQ